MLCNYCRKLDFDAAQDRKTGALHHESFDDLVASARGGCSLCGLIYQVWSDSGEDCGSGRVRCHYEDIDSTLYWYDHLGDEENGIAITCFNHSRYVHIQAESHTLKN